MITATGIGSGLDIENIVSQLVAAEGAATDSRLSKQETTTQSELSALGGFKNALATLQGGLGALNNVATFGKKTASVSDSAILDVSVTNAAAAVDFDVGVTQLAKAHSLAGGAFASATDEVGTGTLTFRFGTTDYNPGTDIYSSFAVNSDRGTAVVTIDSSNNTLEGVRDAVNEANIGVNAVIVNDGSEYRLLFTSTYTGVENSLEINVSDTDANNLDSSGLSALAFNSQATNLDQTVAAQNAVFTVNGLTVQSAENSVNDVVDGVEFTLKDVSGATPVRVTVNQDRDAVSDAVQTFVSSYNGFIGAINVLAGYNAEAGKGGVLQGDFTVRSISARIRQQLNDSVSGLNLPFSTLSEIGITTNADGTLSANSAVLDKAIDENFDGLAGLFAAVGNISDSQIEYLGSSSDTVVGDYAVEITQMATQGIWQGASVLPDFSGPLTIDADNDSFSLTVDGIASGTILITRGDYATGAALAAELQSRINGDSALSDAGASVQVSYDAATDSLQISSVTWGSESQIEFNTVDTDTAAELGFSVGAGTAGLDVAGTIDGITATGTGQMLAAASGSGAEGLKLLVSGGAIGNRGTLSFTRGIANRMDSLLTQWLESDGVLDARVDGLEDRLDDIADRREVLDRRLVALEARLRRQFNALDTLMSQLQNTGNFLTQQLSSLPGSTPIQE